MLRRARATRFGVSTSAGSVPVLERNTMQKPVCSGCVLWPGLFHQRSLSFWH